MSRTLRAIALGAALALALPGAAFAATDSATTVITAQINATLSLSGVPATLDFGSGIPGATLSAPAFTLVILSTDPYTVTASVPNITSGTWNIASHALKLTIAGTTYSSLGLPGVPFTIGTGPPNNPLVVSPTLNTTVDTHSGTYTATITFRAATN